MELTLLHSHKQYLFGFLFSMETKKTRTDLSGLIFFSTMFVIRCNLLRWMFFIPCDKWKTLFFPKSLWLPQDFVNRHFSVFFETSVLKQVRILPLFHNKNAVLSLKLQIRRLFWAKRSLTFRQSKKCGFTLKLVRDMIITYSQMQSTDKYSQHSSIIWPVWLNGWMFMYKLSGCGFKLRCYHSDFRYGAWFEQEVPWHSGKL